MMEFNSDEKRMVGMSMAAVLRVDGEKLLALYAAMKEIPADRRDLAIGQVRSILPFLDTSTPTPV